jgi:hypothetical protein
MKGKIGKQRVYFLLHGILPICVSVLLVKFMCFTNMVMSLNSKLEDRVFALFKGKDLDGKVTKGTLLSMELSGNGFELFPFRSAK